MQSSRRGAVNNPVLGDRWKVISNSYQIRYVRGRSSNGPATLNYHCFDLTEVQGTILSAELAMTHSDNTYESTDPFETVVFRPMDRVRCDAALDASPLRTPSNYQQIFDDLDDGPILAQFQATLSDKNQVERFAVNPTGLNHLRGVAGSSTPWGIGGGLTTASATNPGEYERVFRGTDSSGGVVLPQAQLIMQVLPPGCD